MSLAAFRLPGCPPGLRFAPLVFITTPCVPESNPKPRFFDSFPYGIHYDPSSSP